MKTSTPLPKGLSLDPGRRSPFERVPNFDHREQDMERAYFSLRLPISRPRAQWKIKLDELRNTIRCIAGSRWFPPKAVQQEEERLETFQFRLYIALLVVGEGDGAQVSTVDFQLRFNTFAHPEYGNIALIADGALEKQIEKIVNKKSTLRDIMSYEEKNKFYGQVTFGWI